MKDLRDFLCDVAMCFGVWLIASGGGFSLPNWSLPSWNILAQHATAATYVYEKDATAVPNEVATALDKLNRKGIVATSVDQDVVNGPGQIAAQYKVSIPAAKSAGLPSLVATNGPKVLKVTKDPKTEQDVLRGVP